MKNNSLLELKIFFSIIFLVLLWVSYIVGIIDPFLPYSLIGVVGSNYSWLILLRIFNNFFISGNFLKAIIGWIIILINFSLLISFSYKKSIEFYIFLIYSFLLLFTVSIAPSLATGRLWDYDSVYHLYIVRSLVLHQTFYEQPIAYSSNFFHILIANISIILKINPIESFLFIPQFIMISLFYVGCYLLIYKYLDRDISEKKYIFLLTIFFPYLIFIQAKMTPFSLLVSLMPLALYLSLNLTRENVIMLIIVNLIAILTHVYGLYFFTICCCIIIGKMILNFLENYYIVKFKHILILIWVVYVLTLLFIISPSLIEFVLSLFPISHGIKIRLISGLQTGGTLLNYISIFSFFNVWNYTLNIIPVMIVLIGNQISYFYHLKENIRFHYNFHFQIRIFCDFYFVFILISMFYGYGLAFGRFHALLLPIYVLVSIDYLILIVKKLMKNLNITNIYNKINFNLLTFKNISKFFLLITLLIYFIIPFFASSPYTTAQYDVANWINENLPTNSVFMTTTRLTSFIKGMTLRWADDSFNIIFGNQYPNLTISQKINLWLNLYGGVKNLGYILIDLSAVLPPVSLDVFAHTSYLNLIYNQTNILIYWILPTHEQCAYFNNSLVQCKSFRP